MATESTPKATTGKTTPSRPRTARKRPPEPAPLTAWYASIGAGQAIVHGARDVSARMLESATTVRSRREQILKDVQARYAGLAQEGKKVVSGVRGASYTKAAEHQARVAERQVKAAATSVRKAVDAAATAARSAMRNVG